MEWAYILMHRAYPLPLEKPSSLTMSCGLGFGFRRMILAYFVDHFVTFQGISLDFCIFYGAGGDSPRNIAEKRRNNNGEKKKSAPKKKSWEIWWNAPKKNLSAIREKKNVASEILGYVKAKNCEQSSQFNNKNKPTMPPGESLQITNFV